MAKKQEAQRKHLQAFVDRFRAKASKARQAQSRLKMLAKLEPIAALVDDDGAAVQLPGAGQDCCRRRSSRSTTSSVGYEPGKPVLTEPDAAHRQRRPHRAARRQRQRQVDLRQAARRPARSRDTARSRAPQAQGRLSSPSTSSTSSTPEESAYEHVRRLMPDAPEAKVRARVGAIGFSGRDGRHAGREPVGRREGAAAARACRPSTAPHLLILDEPTNHLDIDSRAALIEALNDYPGAVILISHDRHLIEACADRLWLVQDGTVKPFDGDLDDYRRRVLSESGAETAPAIKPRRGPIRAAARRAAAEKRAETAPLRKRVTQGRSRARAPRRGSSTSSTQRSPTATLFATRPGAGGGFVEDARQRCCRDRKSGRGMAGGERGAADGVRVRAILRRVFACCDGRRRAISARGQRIGNLRVPRELWDNGSCCCSR